MCDSEDEGYIVWTHWVDPNVENLRSGTIRSYLGSYQLFLDFVTMERVRKGIIPEVEADVLRIFRNVSRRLKGWRKTVDLDTRPQRTERLLDECFKGLKMTMSIPFCSPNQCKTVRKCSQKHRTVAISPPLRCAKRETT